MRKLYAKIGSHALIRMNTIPVIGYVSNYTQNFNSSGGTEPITKVTFDFDGNGICDEFFFQDDKLQFSSINILRRKHLREFYKILLEEKNLSPSDLIGTVKTYYVNYEMGFYSM